MTTTQEYTEIYEQDNVISLEANAETNSKVVLSQIYESKGYTVSWHESALYLP